MLDGSRFWNVFAVLIFCVIVLLSLFLALFFGFFKFYFYVLVFKALGGSFSRLGFFCLVVVGAILFLLFLLFGVPYFIYWFKNRN